MTKQELVQRMQEGGAWVPGKRVKIDFGEAEGAIMLDGKMEDDASVKQCQVVVRLAEQLAARDPDLAERYGLDV